MVVIKKFSCQSEEENKKEQIKEAILQFIFPGRLTIEKEQFPTDKKLVDQVE